MLYLKIRMAYNSILSFYLLFIIFLNLSLFNNINCHFFKGEKINVDLKEMLREKINEEKLGETNDCLVSEEEARTILQEKYNIDPNYIDIDQNIRFILGKCYPILYLPGLYASRMVATINCPVFKKDFLKFVKMRMFCQNTVCEDETNEYEEHVIFPAIFDSPFQIRVTDNINKFTACQGYIYSFYNSRTECPEGNCEYSDGVRISYYGGTKKTKSESKCGIKALEDIIYASDFLPSFITNKLTEANLYVMIQDYRKMGYKDGFSAAGISFDYRRYISTFKYFQNSFEYTINRLYRNTGKPVVIITHSLGGLLAYNELLKASPDLLKKIKSFVPIVPPFAGASHLLEAYLYGLGDFDTEINIVDIAKIKIELNKFSESLYFSSAPIVGELRPQSGVLKALEKPEYSPLKLAIEELINVEKECWYRNCESETIKKMTKNYYDVFGEDFYSLAEEDCKLDEEEINNINSNNKLSLNFARKCVTNLYDVLKCPFLIYEKDFASNVPAENMRDLCDIYNSSLLYLSTKDIWESQNSNKIKKEEESKVPLDTIFKGHAKYPLNFNEFYILLDEYNKNFAEKYNKTLTKDDFDTEEEFQKKGERNAEFVTKNSLIKDFPIPPVDTYIVYGNYHKTDVGFVYDNAKKDKSTFDRDEYLGNGGDGTVPNFSSMLTGMKWLYDKKINKLNQTIKLIEYCSLAGKEGNKYAYNTNTFKNKTFIALTCICINEDNKGYNNIDCAHSAIPKDDYLIDMVRKEIIFDENNLNDFNEDKKKAIKNYIKNFDYEQTCNDALYFLNREDMDPIDWF